MELPIRRKSKTASLDKKIEKQYYDQAGAWETLTLEKKCQGTLKKKEKYLRHTYFFPPFCECLGTFYIILSTNAIIFQNFLSFFLSEAFFDYIFINHETSRNSTKLFFNDTWHKEKIKNRSANGDILWWSFGISKGEKQALF